MTEFVLFSLRPHVRVAGAATLSQEAFRAASGTAFSLLAYLVFMLATTRKANLQLIRTVASCFASVELLGWILSSITWQADADDASVFLATSGLHPRSVAIVCAAAGMFGALVILRRSLATRNS